jgi:hypothetical protein
MKLEFSDEESQANKNAHLIEQNEAARAALDAETEKLLATNREIIRLQQEHVSILEKQLAEAQAALRFEAAVAGIRQEPFGLIKKDATV